MLTAWIGSVAIAFFLQAALALGQDHDPSECPFEGIKIEELLECLDEFRTIDGHGNNPFHPEWGAADTALVRETTISYADGISKPAGPNRASVRVTSNNVNQQPASVLNELGTSDYLWQWGQFLDHDVSLTGMTNELLPIIVPRFDPHFDPEGTGEMEIPLERSIFAPDTGTFPSPRQQLNEITSFIDASNVYGSDEVRAMGLRTLDGTGMLLTSEGDLLPFNYIIPGSDPPEYFENAIPHGANPEDFFLAGDIRSNEVLSLTSMHTLFVREHNWVAKCLIYHYPELTGDQIYLISRAIVGAEMQVITYDEFLPALTGPLTSTWPNAYDPYVNPGVFNFFSTVAYRFHSLLSPQLLAFFDTHIQLVPLRSAFFDPDYLIANGIEPLLWGLAHQLHQKLDVLVVDDVRNFLFAPPLEGGLDLPALNMQRGRDHGLPDYNTARADFGLEKIKGFNEISSLLWVQRQLQCTYGNVNNIDAWPALMAEDPLAGSHIGLMLRRVLEEQFFRLRVGDRFWYEWYFEGCPQLLTWLEKNTLSHVIQRNTPLTHHQVPKDVFRVP
jgi:hypothetical protein